MRMKLSFTLLLLVLITLLLFGCATGEVVDESPEVDEEEAVDEVAFEDREWLIGLSQESLDHSFMVTQRAQVLAAAEEYPNVSVIVTDGGGDVIQQVAGIEDMLTQGIDILIVQAAMAEPLKPILTRVHEEGIPFLFAGKPILGTEATTIVSMDNYVIATQIGEFIVEYLTELNGEPQGNVVMITGIPGDETAIARAEGALEIMKEYPSINIVAQLPADYRRPQAVSVMTDILQANPSGTIDVVYASSGEMALGAMQAIEDAGRTGEMIIIGLDGQKEEFEAIKSGKLRATWQYKPAGTEGFELAIKILKGEEVDDNIVVPSEMIHEGNVDQFEPSF